MKGRLSPMWRVWLRLGLLLLAGRGFTPALAAADEEAPPPIPPASSQPLRADHLVPRLVPPELVGEDDDLALYEHVLRRALLGVSAGGASTPAEVGLWMLCVPSFEREYGLVLRSAPPGYARRWSLELRRAKAPVWNLAPAPGDQSFPQRVFFHEHPVPVSRRRVAVSPALARALEGAWHKLLDGVRPLSEAETTFEYQEHTYVLGEIDGTSFQFGDREGRFGQTSLVRPGSPPARLVSLSLRLVQALESRRPATRHRLLEECRRRALALQRRSV